MLIRSAYWLGKPRDGQETLFRDIMSNDIVPKMRSFPGVSSVRILWPQEYEGGAPSIYCQVQVEFADAAAQNAMMTSSERAAVRARVLDAVDLFDGTMAHINFEVG